jgi:hypothetical protein
MSYGTLALDDIQTSGTLTVAGGVVASGDFSAANMSGKNRMINGAMAVDERNKGASQTITAAAALAYTVDRFYAYCTGATVTGEQVEGAIQNTYLYRFTGAASVTAIGFGQRIEALNCADMAGTTATLSVNLSNSLLTSVTWTASYATTTDTFGSIASPTKTQIATGTFTVTSTMTRYTANISVPSAATTGIEIVFTVGAQTSGTWDIEDVQFEAGSEATPFERRLIGQEIQLCTRYFEQYGPNASSITNIGAAFSDTTTAAVGMMQYSVKRVPPTITLAGSTLRYTRAGTDASSSSVVFSEITTTACTITLTTTGLTSGAGGFFGLNTSANIPISAEL